MNKLLVYFGILLIFSINFASADTICFQEYANVSTDCGGLDSGLYYENGHWNAPINSLYDGDYFISTSYSDDDAVLLINYTKPTSATSALWQIKDNDGSEMSDLYTNISIENLTSVVQLRVNNSYDDGSFFYQWFNGSNWVTLKHTTNANVFYEEAIIWDIYEAPLTSIEKSCNSFYNAFGEFGTYLGLISLGVAIAIGIGLMSMAGFEPEAIVLGTTALIFAAILIILGVSIQGYLCQAAA